jgi:hypothetical protein
MLRLTLGEYRLDRLSSGEQTGRACRKSATVIASQSCWQREQHGCNRRELVSSQCINRLARTLQPTTMCRLPHAKAITGHNRLCPVGVLCRCGYAAGTVSELCPQHRTISREEAPQAQALPTNLEVQDKRRFPCVRLTPKIHALQYGPT